MKLRSVVFKRDFFNGWIEHDGYRSGENRRLLLCSKRLADYFDIPKTEKICVELYTNPGINRLRISKSWSTTHIMVEGTMIFTSPAIPSVLNKFGQEVFYVGVCSKNELKKWVICKVIKEN